ncbi:MAG: PIN domain-containing protein [Thiohalomonadales bacterium]
MSDKFFIDTNIFIYTFDTKDHEKKSIATLLIQNTLNSGDGVISYQVVQEFLNVATRKFKHPLTALDAKKYLETVLTPLCQVYASLEMFAQAIEISERWQYGYYDSLIVAAAISSGCSVLYTEDLHDGQKIQSIEIVNPFKKETRGY